MRYKVKIGGLVGVPYTTYLLKGSPEQFETIGWIGAGGDYNVGPATIQGTLYFKRILCRRRV